MKLDVRRVGLSQADAPLLCLPFHEEDDAGLRVEAFRAHFEGEALPPIVADDFRGKKGETLVLYGPRSDGGPRRLLLLGLGPQSSVTTEILREVGGRAASRARALRLGRLAFWLPVDSLPSGVSPEAASRAVTEGIVLGSWRFDELRTEFEGEEPIALEAGELILTEDDASDQVARGLAIGRILAEAQNYARDLVSRPANVVTPESLANEAQALGDERGLKVQVLDRAAMEKEGMNTLLSVASGSEKEPRFIVMEYPGDRDGSPLVLIGKGVTFDSGGLSLKSAQNMETMKYDKAGAVAVLGAMRAIAELDVAAPVYGLIPAVENLPSGRAVKPGDVIRSHSGKTVEVVNTDAEGRLILADALSYARRYEPAGVVDVATLTGACVVALGHHAIGLMGNDPSLIHEIEEAGRRSGERVWQLPLWEEYREQLKSEVADIKNTGGRAAGTITAGMFLREFVGSFAWAHLDIAGKAWADQSGPYQPKGATGASVRLLAEWVRSRSE